MSLDDGDRSSNWNKQVLETTRANLKAECARLRLRVDTGDQSGADVSKEKAALAACEANLESVEGDLKKFS